MELWIRSQDKTDLVKVNALWIMDNQIWMEVPFYENHKKVGLSVTGNNHKLAQYKTKERALEVLDEIQGYIKLRYLYELKEYDAMKTMLNGVDEIKASNNMIVYQMPEE